MKSSQNSFKLFCIVFIFALAQNQNLYSQTSLTINELEYFDMPGLSVMVFDDYYPVGRQGGVTIIQNDVRVAANGDLQLRGYSKNGEKLVDKKSNTIQRKLSYEDIPFNYSVSVQADGSKIKISLDLDNPLHPIVQWSNIGAPYRLHSSSSASLHQALCCF